MSGAYAAVLPIFGGHFIEPEGCVAEEPSLDDQICYLRWRYPEMIECLDDRLKRQQDFVERILKDYGWTAEALKKIHPDEAEAVLEEEILLLCYHILRDIEYVDNLR
jgi:hypothetical protein